MDPYEGQSNDPLSLHKFVYASSNPVDDIDPTGNDEIAEQLGSFSVGYTIAAMSVLSAAIVCTALINLQHGPGICGSKYTPLTLYRGLSGKNPGQLKPEYFEGDGLSLYEQLWPGNYRFKLAFEIDYLEPKTAGTKAAHILIPPFLGSIATITYTPEFENTAIGQGHWSLQLNLAGEILELLIKFMKESATPL